METEQNLVKNRVDLLLLVTGWLFKISLALGTALIVLFLLSNGNEYLIIIGIYYIVIAVLINAAALVVVVLFFFSYPIYRNKILIRAVLLLSNIPIAGIYYYIAIAIWLNR